MQDIQVIIFSKNRAMQLDALLKTIKKYAPFFTVHVLYTYENEEYYRAYEILKAEYTEVSFHKETIIKHNVQELLSITSEYMAFLCDDDLYFSMQEPVELPSDVLCYSPRLGLNTTYCYIYDKEQVYTGNRRGDQLLWEYSEAQYDFSYPFSVDGHIFRTADMRELISSIEFTNPHHLENNLAQQVHFRKKIQASLHSSLVGVPHNKVHQVFDFRSAGGSAAKLNQLFLEGHRIDPFSMDYTNVYSVHQELPYKII